MAWCAVELLLKRSRSSTRAAPQIFQHEQIRCAAIDIASHHTVAASGGRFERSACGPVA